MSRRRKGQKASTAAHVRLYFGMLDSLAWKKIPLSAKCLYVEVLKKWAGGDKNEIKLSYSIIRLRLGFSNPTISRALIFLEKFGFIRKVHVGGLFQSTSIYALSDEWQNIKSKSGTEAATATALNEMGIRRRRCQKENTIPGNYNYSQKLTRDKVRN